MTASPQAGAEPAFLVALVERYDPAVADVTARHARIRLTVNGVGAWDAVVHPESGAAALEPPTGDPDALLTAAEETWRRILEDVRGGMGPFEQGGLLGRRDRHLPGGFLAAAPPPPTRRVRPRRTPPG